MGTLFYVEKFKDIKDSHVANNGENRNDVNTIVICFCKLFNINQFYEDKINWIVTGLCIVVATKSLCFLIHSIYIYIAVVVSTEEGRYTLGYALINLYKSKI